MNGILAMFGFPFVPCGVKAELIEESRLRVLLRKEEEVGVLFNRKQHGFDGFHDYHDIGCLGDSLDGLCSEDDHLRTGVNQLADVG